MVIYHDILFIPTFVTLLNILSHVVQNKLFFLFNKIIRFLISFPSIFFQHFPHFTITPVGPLTALNFVIDFLSQSRQSKSIQLRVMKLHLLCCKSVLVDKVISLTNYFEVVELALRIIIASHRSRLGIKMIWIYIQIQKILRIILSISDTPKTLELFVFGIFWRKSSQF